MELKPGYKQTEVGLIPEEWEVKRLGDVTDVDPENLGSDTRSDFTFNYISLEDVDCGTLKSHSEHVFHTAPSRARRRLRKGDILVATVRPNLKSHLLFAEDGQHWVCSTGFAVVRCKEQVTYPGYVFFHLFGYCVSKQIETLLTGSNYPAINSSDVRALDIPLPPVPEQRVIARALGDVDALISTLEKLIAKKHDLKQAAMQQLLTGQTRLPGFSGEWEIRALRSFVRDFVVPMRDKPKRLSGHIPWCRIEDFVGKYLTGSKSGQHVDEQTIREMNLKVYPTGTLLVSCSADLGRCVIVGRPLVSNQTFIGLVMDEALSSIEFFYYYMTSKAGTLNNLSSGTTISYLSREQFENFVVLVPLSKNEQTAIAAILSDMDAEIAALEQRRDKTRALKQGMMQELLTGRIRLVAHEWPEDRADIHMQESHYTPMAKHNWAFNEAVVIAALVSKFGSRDYPLSRLRYTKLAYLMHRHVEGNPEGYLKKAAGPYNPSTRYKGPEVIAQKNGYVQVVRSGKYSGFIAGENINQALIYFNKWYGSGALEWLEQFRYEKKDELELLATIAMAIQDLQADGREIKLRNVKNVLHTDPEWQPKLRREVFSDTKIKRAIDRCQALFG